MPATLRRIENAATMITVSAYGARELDFRIYEIRGKVRNIAIQFFFNAMCILFTSRFTYLIFATFTYRTPRHKDNRVRYDIFLFIIINIVDSFSALPLIFNFTSDICQLLYKI